MAPQLSREEKVNQCRAGLEKDLAELKGAITGKSCPDILDHDREDRAGVIYGHFTDLTHRTERYHDVEDALLLVRNGTYGSCVDCKKDIIERNVIFPTTKRCATCEKIHEEAERTKYHHISPVAAQQKQKKIRAENRKRKKKQSEKPVNRR